MNLAGVYWGLNQPEAALHKYKVIKQIRTIGSRINVYEALQPELGRKVELRLLNQVVEEGSAETQRFEREFKAIARLDHPNVIKVYDWGQSDGKLYYITEKKEASTLQAFLQQGRKFPLEEVLDIGIELASALTYLHDNGIIHRGISPEGVLYDAEAHRPVLNEFTVVKDAHKSDLTARGVGHLTPLMTTPESIGGQEIDCRTDVYLLGSLLYRLLTGKEVMLLSSSSASLGDSRDESSSPEALEVIRRSVEQDPEQRYNTAAEYGAALKEVQERLRLAGKRSATKRTRLPSVSGAAEELPAGPAATLNSGKDVPPTESLPRDPRALVQELRTQFGDTNLMLAAVGILVPLLLVLLIFFFI